MGNRPLPRASLPLAAGAPEITLRLIASDLMIRATLLRLRHSLLSVGAPQDLVDRAELLLAEILNNIAEHAYTGMDPGRIELHCALEPAGIVITVRDWGRPLPRALLRPPCQMHLRSTDGAMNTLPEGGFGWSVIHQLAHILRARRDAGCNQLQCYLPRQDAGPAP